MARDVTEPNVLATGSKANGHDLQQSLRLEDLEYIEKLGHGGFGTVNLMRQRVTGGEVALKAIDRSKVRDAEDRQHLLSERQLLARLTHPFLVKFIGAFKDEERLYLAMERVGSGDLHRYIAARRALTLPEQKLILANGATILGYLAEQGVVFRDLKKENLMVTSNGYLKLIDFGLAKMIGTDPETARTYSFCGSVLTMAPERFDTEGGHSFECDWWALGILAFEVFYSQTPFRMQGSVPAPENALNDALEKLLDEDFIPNLLDEMSGYPGSSPEALALLRSLLAWDPDDRLATLSKIHEAELFSGFDWEALQRQALPPEQALRVDEATTYVMELARKQAAEQQPAAVAAKPEAEEAAEATGASAAVAEDAGPSWDEAW